MLNDDKYYTPWRVIVDVAWQAGFNQPPPRHDQSDSEYLQTVSTWHADRDKFKKRADSLIVGSDMEHPDLAVGLESGQLHVFDDSGVLVRVRGANIPDGGPSSRALAQRIVDCVNGCIGIDRPAEFISEAKGLLTKLVELDLMVHPMVEQWAKAQKEDNYGDIRPKRRR